MISDPLAMPGVQGARPHHHRWREGARAGLFAVGIGAAWSLVVDAAFGHPFKTWRFVGYTLLSIAGPSEAQSPAAAVIAFFAFVTVVFTLVGRVAVSVAHRADAQPSLIIFANTVLTLVTLAFVAFATAFTTSRLGTEAWLQILGSTLVALWALVFRVYRMHPALARDLGHAADE